MKRAAAAALLGIFFSGAALAEQYVDTPGARIHYNAMSTTVLTPRIAREYQVKRSASRGMVVITPQEAGSEHAPLSARVTGKAVNLVGQVKQLEFREVREAEVRYYIAEFRFTHMETLRFRLEVVPEGKSSAIPVEFMQKFYQDS